MRLTIIINVTLKRLPPAGRVSPATVVVATHEHLTAPTADSAVGLVAVVVVLVRTLQEAVLQRMRVKEPVIRSKGRCFRLRDNKKNKIHLAKN